MRAYVQVVVSLEIDLDDGVAVPEVIQDMDYNFISGTDGAMVVDTEIRDFSIVRTENPASPDCHTSS